jgi:hypothetical protein
MKIKNSIDSSVFLEADSNASRIVAGPISVTADRKAGVFVNGTLSITAGITGIRLGPIYKFNPLTTSCVPSTLVTPISTFVFDIPAKHAIQYAALGALLRSTL